MSLPDCYQFASREAIHERLLYVIERDGVSLPQLCDHSLLSATLVHSYLSHPLHSFPFDQNVLAIIDQKIRSYLYQADWIMVNAVYKQVKAYTKSIESSLSNNTKKDGEMKEEGEEMDTAVDLPSSLASELSLDDLVHWLSMQGRKSDTLRERSHRDRILLKWLAEAANESWAISLRDLTALVITKNDADNDESGDNNDVEKDGETKKTSHPPTKEQKAARALLALLPDTYTKCPFDVIVARLQLFSRRDRVAQGKIIQYAGASYTKWTRFLGNTSSREPFGELPAAKLRKCCYYLDCEIIVRFSALVHRLGDSVAREVYDKEKRQAEINPHMTELKKKLSSYEQIDEGVKLQRKKAAQQAEEGEETGDSKTDAMEAEESVPTTKEEKKKDSLVFTPNTLHLASSENIGTALSKMALTWNETESTYRVDPHAVALRGRIISDHVPVAILLRYLNFTLPLHLRHLVDHHILHFIDQFAEDVRKKRRSEKNRILKAERVAVEKKRLLEKRQRDQERRRQRKEAAKASTAASSSSSSSKRKKAKTMVDDSELVEEYDEEAMEAEGEAEVEVDE